MAQKSRTNVLKILITICGENCKSSLVQVSKTKKFKCIIQSRWIITAWQCSISNALLRMGMSEVSVAKMKALIMKMEMVTMIGKGR